MRVSQSVCTCLLCSDISLCILVYVCIVWIECAVRGQADGAG